MAKRAILLGNATMAPADNKDRVVALIVAKKVIKQEIAPKNRDKAINQGHRDKIGLNV